MPSVSERFRRLSEWLGPRAHLAFPLLAFLIGFVATAGIWPDAMLAGDGLYHFANAHDVADAVRNGQDPLGRLPQMMGVPLFRFYQSLHALLVGTAEALTPFTREFWFSFFTITPFLFTPFAYTYMVRCLGFDRWVAGLAGFVSLTTVLGFSNGFIGPFGGGIVTQAPAAFFLPLFVGKFVRVLQGKGGVVAAGALFALTLVAHAAFAVFAAIAAVFAVVILWPKDFRSLVKAGAVGGVGLVLAAFWIVPFLSYQAEHRPIPDIVSRPDRKLWFNGFGGRELGQMLATGRFLDGERDLDRDKGSDEPLDARMRALNIFGLHLIRPPILTWAAVLAAFVALYRIRQARVRFLLALSCMGFLFVLGFDDVRWLFRIPLMGQMQGCRATYLVDQGLLALVAFALFEVARGLARLVRPLPRLGRRIAAAAGLVVVLGGVGVTTWWLLELTHIYMNPGAGAWVGVFRQNLDRHRTRIGPYRIRGMFKGAGVDNKRNNLIHVLGYAVPCAHTTGITGESARAACGALGTPSRSWPLAEMLGVGYFLVDKRLAHGLDGVRDGDVPRFVQLSDARNLQLWESRGRSYLHTAPGPIVLVQASHAQWIDLVEVWVRRYGSRVRDLATPTPVRVKPEHLSDPRLLDLASAIAILDPDAVDGVPRALRRFAGSGRPVYSISALPGLDVRLLGPDASWTRPFEGHAPGLPRAEREVVRLGRATGREFHFRVDLERPALGILAESAFRNWTATVDGRPTPVVPAGPDLASIAIPPGPHRLAFRWVTTPLEWGSYVASIGGWLGVVGLGVWNLRGWRRRRRAGAAGPPAAKEPDPAPQADAGPSDPGQGERPGLEGPGDPVEP